jgi:hypothetical protein
VKPFLDLNTASTSHPEEAGRIASEDRHLFLLAQAGGGEHVIHGMSLKRKRTVRPEHDLARADLRREMSERLGPKHQRIPLMNSRRVHMVQPSLDNGLAESALPLLRRGRAARRVRGFSGIIYRERAHSFLPLPAEARGCPGKIRRSGIPFGCR